MPELILLVVLVILVIKYSKSIKHSAEAADLKTYAWAAQVKVDAIKDIAQIEIDEATVTTANTKIAAIDKLKI